MASAQTNHDLALAAINGQTNSANAVIPNNGASEATSSQFNNLDQSQILNLLRSIPGFTKIGDPKDSDAAQTLSNLSQQSNFPGSHQLTHSLAQAQSQQSAAPQGNPFAHNEPGPSSHPRGPPNLGQLSAIASQSPPLSASAARKQSMGQQGMEEGGSDGEGGDGDKDGEDGGQTTSTGGKRAGRSSTMGSEEWTRQRKDNHKEVERRRRGNINDGINELGRIVPNGSGEKAKGAILSRAVQYIHHLKENEARNIEKWTLEKLLMDQAMGDLQAQLEEMRRLWEEERLARQRLESELDVLRGSNSKTSHVRSRSPVAGVSDHGDEEDEARGTKRQRVD